MSLPSPRRRAGAALLGRRWTIRMIEPCDAEVVHDLWPGLPFVRRARPHAFPGAEKRTCRGVGEVVMCAGRMVDRILAASSGATLQAANLRDETVDIEEIDGTRINQREQVDVQLRTRPAA